jgi:hypothetical protein
LTALAALVYRPPLSRWSIDRRQQYRGAELETQLLNHVSIPKFCRRWVRMIQHLTIRMLLSSSTKRMLTSRLVWQDVGGIELYYTGGGLPEEDNAKFRRAVRERKRRAATAKCDSDDDDDVTFVPKSQTKKTRDRHHIISLLDEKTADSSDDESPQPTAGSAVLSGVLNAETSRRLMELRYAKPIHDHTSLRDDDDDRLQVSQHRWITVHIEGTKESAKFTLEEGNTIKDVISKCVETFKMDPDTPIGLYHENQLLQNTDLLFVIPVQCTLIAKVYNNIHVKAKEAPKGTMMRLTLRGPNGDKEIKIGSLQPLKVALDQYGAGRGLRFDGDVLQLDRQPGAYELEDEDLIDVIA